MPYTFKDPDQLGELPYGAQPAIMSALQRVKAVKEKLAPFADDPAASAVLDATESLDKGTAFAQVLESSARGLLRSGAYELATSANLAAEKVPTVGYGTYQDRQSAVGSEVRKTEGRFVEGSWARALEEKQAEAARLGAAARVKMLEAERTLKGALARNAGPLALRSGNFDLNAASMVGEMRKEAESTALSRIHTNIKALIAGGDLEEERMYVMAVLPIVREAVGLPFARLRERIGPNVDFGGVVITGNMDSPAVREAIEEERKWGVKVLELIEKREGELLPEALKAASVVFYEDLCPAFAAIFGFQAMVIGKTEYEQMKEGHAKQPARFDVHPNWAVRVGKAVSSTGAKRSLGLTPPKRTVKISGVR